MNKLPLSHALGAQKQIVFGETLKALENAAESVIYGDVNYVAITEPNNTDNKSSKVIGFYNDDTVTVRAYALYTLYCTLSGGHTSCGVWREIIQQGDKRIKYTPARRGLPSTLEIPRDLVRLG